MVQTRKRSHWDWLGKTPLAIFTKEKSNWDPHERINTFTKLMFRIPDVWKMATLTLLTGLLIGLTVDFGVGGLIYGLFVFTLGAYAAAFVHTRLIELSGERFTLRRGMFSSFASLAIVAFVLLVGTALRPQLGLGWRLLVIYGFCLDLAFRYIVVRSTSVKHRQFGFLVSFLPLIFLTLFFLPFCFLDWDIIVSNKFPNSEELRFTAICILGLLGTSYAFIEVINAPMRNEFNLIATDLVGYFLSYITTGNKKLEILFRTMGEESCVPVNTFIFRRPKDRSIKVLATVPGVHPGPVGELGGGDLPTKINEHVKDMADHVMCFHGSSTNDQNPVDGGECLKVAEGVRKLVSGTTEFSATASTLRYCDGVSALSLQSFGDCALAFHESTQGVVDDLSSGTGQLLEREMLGKGLRYPTLIDCHNYGCHTARVLNPENKVSRELVERTGDLAKDQKEQPQYPMRLGYGSSAPFSKVEGLGKLGIQVAVLELLQKDDTGGPCPYRIAYVLCDGNNMRDSFTEAAEELCRKTVDDVRVLTTDNHVVNAVIGGYNPIGERTDRDKFLRAIQDSLTHALEDLEEVEVGFNSGFVESVKVIGHGNGLRLVTVINTTMAAAKTVIVPFLFLAFTLSAIAYYLA